MKLEEKAEEGYSLVSSANTVQESMGRKFRNLKGMGWFVTCLFIVGETAGGGLIALPNAMVSTGLVFGCLMIAVGALMCTYTGVLLSENWTVLQARWPEYRSHCRKPYPAMGLRALGPSFAHFVSICLDVTQFGTAVVFLLLAARNIESFLQMWGGFQVGFCYLVGAVALFMTPITFLKSPKDFWWAIIAAMITTTLAVTLILYGAAADFPTCGPIVNLPPLNFKTMFMPFGTVMFAYGGHGAFPTIQHDMKKPYQFKRAVVLAFIITSIMYVPVSIMGYVTYGDSLRHSVIPSLQSFYIQQSVNLCITLHVTLALTIVFNPLNLELEDALNLPHDFGWHRVVARTGMMLAVVIVALSCPNFGVLLDLVGGSTITLMALVFPIIFHLYLCAANKKYKGMQATPDEQSVTLSEIIHYTSKPRLFCNLLVLSMAIAGGLMASGMATEAMIHSQFSPPCYASLWGGGVAEADAADIVLNAVPKLHCCGIGKNITRFAELQCIDPGAVISGGGHG